MASLFQPSCHDALRELLTGGSADELKASLSVERKAATAAKHEAASLALENQRLAEELAEKTAAAKSHAEELEALQKKLTEVESRRSRLFKPIRVGPASSSRAKVRIPPSASLHKEWH